MTWFPARVLVAAVLAAALTVPLAVAQTGGAGDLAIVTHPDTPVDQLSFADVRQVLKGERQYWTKDLPVVLFVRAPTSAERSAVLDAIYQMSEPQFKQYWIAKKFRAETATSPVNLKSNDATQQFVATTAGAVGFMAARDVKPGVKVLKVDGRLPGEKGYRLHLTGK
jgi:ABC-type phosphate transport system substrate-binding protein